MVKKNRMSRMATSASSRYWLTLRKDIARDKRLYIMLIPFVMFYIIFQYKPMTGLVIAFKDYNVFTGINESPWVGFQNFQRFFFSPYFFRTLKNTIIISLYDIIFGFPAPIILALLFNELRCKWFKSAVQTITYVPYFISSVIVAGMVTTFLSPSSGLINNIIELFGGERKYFLTQPQYFRGIFTITNIWKSVGFGSIVYLAALTSIDVSMYEAAVLDGAGKWKQVIHITLPSILPTIIMMLIMKIGNILNVGYEMIILLYQPATYETADVINTYVYRVGLVEAQYSLAAAVGLFNGLVGMILVCGANYFSKRLTEYSLW